MLVLCTGVGTVSATEYIYYWDGISWSNGILISYDAGGFGRATLSGLAASKTYWFYLKKEEGDPSYWKNNGTMTETDYNWKFTTYENDASFTTTIAGDYTIIVKWYDDGGNNWYPHISIVYPKAIQYTVHFKKPAGWSSVYAQRFFNGTEFYNTISPGTELSANSINSDYYDVTFSDNINSIVFSDNGDGEKRSASIAIDFSATEYWVTEGATSATTTLPSDFTYTRSGLSVGKFGTICMPYAIASVTGAKLYKIASQVKDGGTLTGVNLEEVTSGFVAGESYIFEASAESFTVTLSGSYTTTAADANGLQGNLSADAVAVANDGSKYVIQDNKVKKVVSGGSGVTCGQYRAYITLTEVPDAGSSPAPGLLFLPMFGGETTGIENAVKSEEIKDKSYFNLAGQRVAQPTKGLYTVNGRKVVIK